MKNLFISLFTFSFIVFSMAFGQMGGPVGDVPGIINVAPKEHIPTKRMIPYEYVREADLVWSKRVWQTIDLREKINHPIYYPLDEITQNGTWNRHSERWSLWTIIRTHIISGDLRVFSPYNPNNVFGEWDGDQLKYPIDPQEGLNYQTDSLYRNELLYYMSKLGAESDVPKVDDLTGENLVVILPNGIQSFVYDAPDTIWFTSKDIIEYRLKEDWFFDKERSVLDVRIIAIAPVVYLKEVDANGVESISGTRELFWIYFPHCRFVFNNYFVYNDKNDALWMSFDDLFWKRRFNAVMYKESNNFDRKIESYKAGADALYEAQRVKEEIRTIEHDLWDF